MTQSSVGPRRLARQAWLMNLVNVPMRFLLRLPIAMPLSHQLMLLYLTGRKTGKTYLQPVSFVRDGNTLLTPGGGRWKLNHRRRLSLSRMSPALQSCTSPVCLWSQLPGRTPQALRADQNRTEC